MATKKNTQIIEIPALDIRTFTIKIIGKSPLISHNWSEKAKRMMLEKQTKENVTAKETRRPIVEFADSLYWLTEKPNLDGLTNEEAEKVLAEVIPQSKFGFPAIAFKTAAIDAGYQQKILDKKTTARGAFHILGEFAVIEGIPECREDIARIGMGTADLRFRGMFREWRTELLIEYNTGAMSMKQIIALFNAGGFSNGVGDWRAARDGDFGKFYVEG